ARYCLDDSHSFSAQGHDVERYLALDHGFAVLAACRRQPDEALVQVNFTPAQTADFFTPLAGEDQQLDDLAIVIVAAGIPHLHQFWLAQVVARALALTVSAARADAEVGFSSR